MPDFLPPCVWCHAAPADGGRDAVGEPWCVACRDAETAVQTAWPEKTPERHFVWETEREMRARLRAEKRAAKSDQPVRHAALDEPESAPAQVLFGG